MNETNPAGAFGFYGRYGGRYVPEMLVPALNELSHAFSTQKEESGFQDELASLYRNYAGRPTPLYHAANLSKKIGQKIYLKMEALTHTGAHKINNVLGQALLARKMGKRCIIAETGAGQHGLATATVAAKFGLDCKVFMGEVDVKRQYPNVFAMKLLGAEVIPVRHGSRTLKDAVNAALKYWIEHLSTTYYLLGSVLGPHPYPTMVKEFQSIIGRETKEQITLEEGRLPDVLVACVGGGSNAMGLFSSFLESDTVKMFGIEAGGIGDGPGANARRFGPFGRIGVVQGYRSRFLQDENGQVMPTHSISAGLDYAGVGPELAYLFDRKRIEFHSVCDGEALTAYQELARCEGIIPALESAHALAYVMKIAPTLASGTLSVVNLSGRGDKDLFITAKALNPSDWGDFLTKEVNDVKSIG